jgi:hypothetical protein
VISEPYGHHFQPGLALLTLFLSRVEVIKQGAQTASDMADLPSYEESQQWSVTTVKLVTTASLTSP